MIRSEPRIAYDFETLQEPHHEEAGWDEDYFERLRIQKGLPATVDTDEKVRVWVDFITTPEVLSQENFFLIRYAILSGKLPPTFLELLRNKNLQSRNDKILHIQEATFRDGVISLRTTEMVEEPKKTAVPEAPPPKRRLFDFIRKGFVHLLLTITRASQRSGQSSSQ